MANLELNDMENLGDMQAYVTSKKFTLLEEINVERLEIMTEPDIFAEHFHKLSNFKNAKSKFQLIQDINTKRSILMERKKNKKNEVKYNCTTNSPEGRLFATTSSLQNLPRVFRAMLCQRNDGSFIYHDIDVVNAHPTFLRWYCRVNKIKHPLLDGFIENRDEFLQLVMDKAGCDRDNAKTLFLALLNGGGNKTVEELQIDSVSALNDELKQIRKEIMKKRPDLKSRAEMNKKDNIDGTCANYLFCEIENKVLQCMYSFFMEAGISTGVFAFDGCQVYADHCPDDMDSLIDRIQHYILEKLGILIKLAVKPFDVPFIDWNALKKKVKPKTKTAQKELEKAEKAEYGRVFDPILISDEKIGLYIIDRLQTEKKVYWHKVYDELFILNETSILFEISHKDRLSNFISSYSEDYFIDIGLKGKNAFDIEKLPDDYQKKIYDRFESVYSANGQRWIQSKMVRNLRDCSTFIDTHFDQIPHLFPIADNKVVDFINKEVVDRLPEHYFTKTTDNVFLENHDSSAIQNYIRQILKTENQVEIDAYLSLCGYGLTAEISIKKFPVLTGDGDNGKSLALSLDRSVKGPFGYKGNRKIIYESKNEAVHNAEMIPITKGIRSCYFPEAKPSDKFNEPFIKDITGDDGQMSLRDTGGKEKLYTINTKFFGGVNGTCMPPIDDKQGFANRLLLIPFLNRFERSDKRKKEILAMKDDYFTELCHYTFRFYDNDRTIDFPESWTNATFEVLDEYDFCKKFLASQTAPSTDCRDKIAKIDLFNLYSDYAREEHKGLDSDERKKYPILGRNAFYKEIKTRFKDIKEDTRSNYCFIKLT